MPKPLKIGTVVEFKRRRRNGIVVFGAQVPPWEHYTQRGRIAGSDVKPITGIRMYSVNIAERGANAVLFRVRASQLTVVA